MIFCIRFSHYASKNDYNCPQYGDELFNFIRKATMTNKCIYFLQKEPYSATLTLFSPNTQHSCSVSVTQVIKSYLTKCLPPLTPGNFSLYYGIDRCLKETDGLGLSFYTISVTLVRQGAILSPSPIP